MALNINSNINENWGEVPYTGQLVQDAIKGQFNSIITAVNDTVKDIAFTKETEATDEFSVRVTKTNGTVSDTTIKLTPVSEKVITLTRFDVPAYSQPGLNVLIVYAYHIAEEGAGVGSYINNKSATIKLYVNNGLIAEFAAVSTYKNSDAVGRYTIDGSHIKEGNNSIRISMSFNDGGSAAFVSDDGVFTTLQLLSFNFKLDANLTGLDDGSEDIEKAIRTILPSKTETQFGLDLRMTDSTGRLLTSSTYGLNASNINTTIYSGITSNVNTYTGTSINNLVLSTIVGDASRDEYPFYILSSLQIGNTTVYSDVVKFLLISNPSSQNGILYAYKLKGMSSVDKTLNRITCTQYDNVNLNLFAFIPSDTTISYKVNNLEITNPSKTADLSQLLDLSWSTQLMNSGTNTISVSATNGISFTVDVLTIPLANDLVPPSNVTMDFTAAGKNTAVDTLNVNGYTFKFTGFDWSSNGWDTGENALVVNNGAKVEINLSPCYNTTAKSISFRFKTVNENTSESIISCVQNNCDGFKITPQSATIYLGSLSKSTQFSSEDSIKEVTFVWYGSNYGNTAIIYVNGTSQMILSEGSKTSNNNTITLTADNTTLYLYNILYYNKALNFSEILALYNIHNSLNIGEYSKQNAIFDSTTSIGNNGLSVTIDKLPIGSVYMLIRAHEDGVKNPWDVINSLPATDSEGKETKRFRLLAGETYLIKKMTESDTEETAYAGNFYADRISLSGQGTSSMKYPIKNFRIYFKKAITNRDTFNTGWNYDLGDNGGDVSKTQTFIVGPQVSSINFHSDEITVGSGGSPAQYSIFDKTRRDENNRVESSYTSVPANVFCLKADYAESSGMHNTGFARLSNYALENSGNILENTVLNNNECVHLPMNEVDEASEFPYDIRQSIDGRLIYLFFQGRDEQGLLGDIVYAGKYNLNNEKASEDVFGFTNNGELYPSYFDNQTVKNEAELLKNLFNLNNELFENYKKTHSKFKDNSGTSYINPAECWEFSTNAPTTIEHLNLLGNIRGNIGAFAFPYMKDMDGTALGSEMPDYNTPAYRNLNPFREEVTESSTDSNLAWLDTEQAWEFRYPNFDNDDDGYQLYANGETPYLLCNLYKWLYKNNVYLWSNDQKESHAAVFARDLHLYFNVNYLLKYYVLTKMFVNADQRIKNCMLSFYCDPKVEVNDGSNGNYPMGHMRAFYIFYDNDTILGVTNTGLLELPWNADETSNVYRGIDLNDVSYHAIWGNIEYCYNAYINNTSSQLHILALGKLVETTYRNLRTLLTDSVVKSYLNSELPDAADNVDAEVKYLYPKTISSSALNFNTSNIEQYQGNRKYHREWFLNKRFKWLDAIYGSESILNYYFGFKFANVAYLDSNTVDITTSINKWRFYYNSEGAINTPTKLLLINNNIQDSIGTLTVTYNQNSNVNSLRGLYGASKIDFSNFYGNGISGLLVLFQYGNKLPNLKEFIFGPHNEENETKSLHVSDLGFLNSNFIPNVEELVLLNLIKNEGDTITCDLSTLKMLRTLDTTNSLLDVTLPQGSKLLSVILYKPTNLTLTNNTALTSIDIQDVSELTSINISHCSDYIYNYVFDYAVNHYDDLNTFNVTIGHNDDFDEISNLTLENLVTLATIKIQNNLLNIVVTGKGRNLSITSELKAVLLDAFGDTLTIIDIDTDEFSLTISSQYLRENQESVLINSNKLATYSLLLSGEDASSLLPYITLSKTNQASFMTTLSAAPIFDNVSRSCVATVVATSVSSGEIISSQEIFVSYVAATSISARVVGNDNYIVNSGGSSILLNVDSNSTKQHLLSYALIELLNYVNISVTTGHLEYTYNSESDPYNKLLTQISFTPSENEDSLLTISVQSNTLCSQYLYFDKEVCTKTEAQSSESYGWLNDLLNGEYDSIDSSVIRRSHLSQYSIVTENRTIKSSNGKFVQSNENVVYDLTTLKYFKNGSSLFVVPSAFKFTDISIPEGFTQMQWTDVFADCTTYRNFYLPSTLNSAAVRWSVNSLPRQLCFDLSKVNNITKIFNNQASLLSSGIFNISITCESNGVQTPDAQTNLFIYPVNKIEQIGNYSESIGGDLRESLTDAMFNITLAGEPWDYTQSGSALYNLGVPTNNNKINVGYISSYKMNTPCFTWSSFALYVKGLYYTFYKGSGCEASNVINLMNVEVVGDGSFYNNSSGTSWGQINIGTNCTKIGSYAFTNLTATITSGQDITLNNVALIHKYAFALLSGGKIFNIKDISLIGERAFSTELSNGHTINIETDIVPTLIAGVSYLPFGANKYNTINLTTNNLNVRNAFNIYADYVNIN